MLFDQDAVVPTGSGRRPRQSAALDRQREREMEISRVLAGEQEHQTRRRRAQQGAPPPLPPSAPIRISSRPYDSSAFGDLVLPDPPGAPSYQLVLPRQAPRSTRSQVHGGATRASQTPRGPQTLRGETSTGRATAVLAAGTFVSRLSGFLRVLVIGYVLGVGNLSDAFNYANGIPNIMYDLLIGGILAATLIPVFVDILSTGDADSRTRSLSAVLTAVTAALAVVTAVLWLFAPWVIRFYLVLSPSSTGPPERALATHLLRYFAPQVFFLGAIVVSTAMLNARRSFTVAAVSPVVNNLIGIAALLATKILAARVLTARGATGAQTLAAFGRDGRAVLVLGLGTTFGYAVQLLIQLPAMRRAGLRVRLVWDLRHPAVRRVAGLSSWLAGVVLANQASLALVMILAVKTPGGVTAYQFSYQFFQLPYALVAVSVASAIMPSLAARWTAGDRRGFERQLVTGLRITLALLLPAGLVYVAVAQPFVQLAIHHGRVGASGAQLVGSSLALFAAGLPGFSAYFLLMRAYQAMQDARAMFWIYILENGLTVVAALILDPVLGVPGLALAWVGPYTVASIVAVVDLRRRVGDLGGSATLRALVRIAIASGATAAVVVLVGVPFPARAGDPVLVARLAVQVGLGAAVYLGLGRAMHIDELRPVVRMVRSVAARL